MSAQPPKPATERRRRNKPVRGEWKAVPGIGWQHGPLPVPPDGLMPASLLAWQTWMQAWFAAHWSPDDLPMLRKAIKLYDATERGELHRSAELRMLADGLGITPKGQQDRRWVPPKADDVPKPAEQPAGSRYGGLKVIAG